MKLGDIIKSYREVNNMSMDDFAKVSGISKGYISMLEKNINTRTGKEIKPAVETIQKAAKGMFMTFDELFAMIDPEAKIKLNSPQYVKKAIRIPVLGKVAAGIPIEAVEDVLDYEEVSEKMARLGELFALRIKGDSMAPRIEDGDVIVVLQQDDAETNDIVVAMTNGDDATCKRLFKYPNGIRLVAENPAYSPLIFSNEDIIEKPVRIIGKVVEIRKKLY